MNCTEGVPIDGRTQVRSGDGAPSFPLFSLSIVKWGRRLWGAAAGRRNGLHP